MGSSAKMSVDINVEALSDELKLEGNKLFAGLSR